MTPMSGRVRHLWLLLFALCLLAPALAGAVAWREPLRVWSDPREVAASMWHDPAGNASADEARVRFDAGLGRPVESGAVAPLGQGGAVWFQLRFPVPEQARRAVLEIPHPGIDLVEFHRQAWDGRWTLQAAGDALPVSGWPEAYIHPVFHFTLMPGESAVAYLRVRNLRDTGVSWVLRDAGSFNEASRQAYLLSGLLLGLMTMVMLVSLFSAWGWRDPVHLLYTVHTLIVSAVVGSVTGLAGVHLWPNSPLLNDRAGFALPLLALGTLALLTYQVVHERGMRWPTLALPVLASVNILLAILVFGAGRPQNAVFSAAVVLFALLALLTIFGQLAWQFWTTRAPGSAWMVASVGVLFLGAVPLALRTTGVLPISSLTQYSLTAAWLLEAPLMLAGLYFRSRQMRDERLRLRSVVEADPLTRVANGARLRRRLQRLLRRASVDSRTGAVVRVRVANLEAIQSYHGREAADAAIVRAAECLVHDIGPMDLLAREVDGDFVLLMSGIAGPDQLAELGRALIARGLKFSPRLPPQLVLKLQVVALAPPLPAETPEQLLQRLHRAMDELAVRREPPSLRVIEVRDGVPTFDLSSRISSLPPAPTSGWSAMGGPGSTRG